MRAGITFPVFEHVKKGYGDNIKTMIVKTFPTWLLIALTLVLTFSGCKVQLVAPYDEVTDAKVATIQERVVIKFTEWKRSIPDVSEENEFYDVVMGSLEVLIQRNQAIEKSDIIVRALKKVQENIGIIRGLHEESELSLEVLEQVEPDIMAQFNSIQKFLMALKRAETK